MFEKLMEIKWGSFTPIHIASLVIAASMIVGLYFILKNKQEKTQKLVLFIISLIAPFAVIYNILVWGFQSTVLEYLPLHLCSINAILLPILVWRKSNFLGNLLPVYSVGAVAALVFNTFQAEYSIFDHVFAVFYFGHTVEFGIPMLMLALGLVKIKPKYIGYCLSTTFVLYTAIHFINILVNNYLAANNFLDSSGNVIWVNYMYSIAPMGNPALEFFWNLLPYEYFYMLSTLPLFALVYVLMNIGNIVRAVKEKKSKQNAL